MFPGDTQFRCKVHRSLNNGDSYSLSSITTTVHLGAHADAPSHYARDGVNIEQRDLMLYLGQAQVIEVPYIPGGRISESDLRSIPIQAKRILFKTNSFPDPDKWNEDFMALAPSLVDYLALKEVKLVGIDTPSVDLANDQEMRSHHRIAKADMAILEGLVLKNVRPGIYDLIALPLNMEGAEASPVRAVLLEPYAKA